MKLEAKNKIIEGINYLKDNFSIENINMSTDCIWEAIRIIRGDGVTKTYYLNCPDSDDEYSGIKIALDNTINMHVGDDLGMIAYLLPHSYLRSNPYKLTTSNYNIVDVEGFILTAKKEGTVTITATSMNDKYSDSITINVIKKEEYIINDNNIYIINENDFNFIENDYSYKSSLNNTNQWNCLLRYCKNNNIKKVIFPKDKKYYFEVQIPLSLKNNLEIDLNNSELIVSPNHYNEYEFIKLIEEEYKVNILDGGYCNENGELFEISRNNSIDTGKTWIDENNNTRKIYVDWYKQCSYNIQSTDTIYLNGELEVKETPLLNDIFKKYIEKNKNYKICLDFTKYKTIDKEFSDYTSNTIKLIVELYKNNIKQSERILESYTWKPDTHMKNKFSTIFSITEDCDYIKIKIEGLADINNPTRIILGEPILYLIDNIPNKFVENIFIKNGYIKGDGYVLDADGNDVKDKIMQECYNSGWRNVEILGKSIEASNNLIIEGGKNIIFNNCYIGDSPGFNISIGNCIALKNYYPNANNLEYGNINELNGINIETDKYVRSPLIDIHEGIKLSNQILITDPTHVTIYYYGYFSRLINIYFYDIEQKYIGCQLFKLRHSILTIPENTYYIRLSVPLIGDEKINNTGNSDFGNSIFSIKFTKKNRIEFYNCEIAKNYSCGIAHSGNGVIIDNCNFHDNIGRMPWCDIDSEDGWEKMQNNIFKNSIFNSQYGIILCSGINYVFKNNIIKSFTGYDQEQNIKWYKNTFIPGGFGASFSCQGECYFINNTLSDLNVNTSKAKSDGKYQVYFYDNKFSNGRISLIGDNNNNLYSGKITALKSNINGITDNFNNLNMPNVTEIEYLSSPVNNSYFSKINYYSTNIDLTFNNCTIETYPKIYSAGRNNTYTFNNCTISNGKENQYYIFNNCNFNNDIQENNIVTGLIRENLIAALPYASGKYFALQEEKYLNLFNNPFTLTAKITKINNWNCEIISTTDFIIGTSWDSKIVIRLNGMLNGANKNYYYCTVNIDVGEATELIYQAIYDKNTIKIYINNNLLQTINIDPNFIINNTNTVFNINNSQCNINNFYLYDRTLTEEEILQNYNALLQSN